MFTIPEEIMKDTNLTSTDKLVYAYITKTYGQISFDKIAAALGVTRMTAIKCIDRLVQSELITSSKNEKGWNVYEESK